MPHCKTHVKQLVPTSCTCPPFMICSTVTSLLKGRSGSSLGVSRKHCGVPSLHGSGEQTACCGLVGRAGR